MAMEVASQPFLSATQDEPDIMDIDIDMDVDIEALGDEDGLEVLLSLSPPLIASPELTFLSGRRGRRHALSLSYFSGYGQHPCSRNIQ